MVMMINTHIIHSAKYNDNGQWRAYDSSEEGTIDEDNQEEEKDQEHLIKKTLRHRQIRTADDTDDTQGE